MQEREYWLPLTWDTKEARMVEMMVRAPGLRWYFAFSYFSFSFHTVLHHISPFEVFF